MRRSYINSPVTFQMNRSRHPASMGTRYPDVKFDPSAIAGPEGSSNSIANTASSNIADIPTSFISSTAAMSNLVDILSQLETDLPSIYVDLEGIKLSREGSISILTLMLHPSATQKHVYLIDVHTLGGLAFNTSGKNGVTMKDILEEPTIPKVFFDVRNDSDALYAHFNIALQGVEDVQLMENASRRSGASKRFLNGLVKCVKYDAAIGYRLFRSWNQAKFDGELLFDPKWAGGSYQVFNLRPLPTKITAYCIGDVQYLPHLRDVYWGKLTAPWKVKVGEETKNRVLQSQLPGYQPCGSDRALGPWQDNETIIGSLWNQHDSLEDPWDDWQAENDDDWFDTRDDNDYEDWTRVPWQGPPS
ncbi:uncharacterized protein B0I36DRAFT_316440 [Microdochium trichocladiopsis]|uniref:3'-5' exonuclease domain-containing protein n=1 Tax=Microdochium trichocladiopsis TaxID=1682393 RepID=A0A9P8Y7T4_9PEZI|nr:uncharacterized protein B0I36DRAFT_316440 [Microdochium trichocladiopsis]KAH7034504.1 hypothetical protein B0I36DRAFT_316440 [Microdochium trichocladiopsis]